MKLCLVVGILAALGLLSACTETPTGRSQLILIPPDTLAEMGRSSFEQIKSSRSISADPVVNQLVTCVAERLIDAIPAQFPQALTPQQFQVVVFDNPTPNAFALPDGSIGVHTGMLDVAASQHQLAAVVGHEIAHVLASHGNERMTQQLGINAILLVIGLFSDTNSEMIIQALGLGAHYGIALPFSRAHETEADVMGLYLMAEAGFDPAASVALWENMAKQSSGAPLEFMSTHPGHDTRIQDLQAKLPLPEARFEPGAPTPCDE